MPLNQQEKNFFTKLKIDAQQNQSSDMATLTLATLRESTKSLMEFAGKEADVPSTQVQVKVRDGKEISCKIYNNHLKNCAAIFFIPGCGYLLDVFDLNCVAASRVAKYSAVKIIAIQHRLSPEHRLPGPIYDCYDAIKYMASNPSHYSIDANNIYIFSLSSGAQCAASISLLARSQHDFKIQHLFLLNGSYDFTVIMILLG